MFRVPTPVVALLSCAVLALLFLTREWSLLELPSPDMSSDNFDFLLPPRPFEGLLAKLEKCLGKAESKKYLGAPCRPTSQVRIRQVGGESQNNTTTSTTTRWILESLDERGRPKQQGGDEFYVAYFDDSESANIDPTAVALVQDRQDGTYALDFVTTPMHRQLTPYRQRTGKLHVYFQYTCGLGKLSPSAKETWQSAGMTNLHTFTKRIPEPPIRLFRPPPFEYNLSQYSTVFFVGDSLFQQLAKDDSKHYFRPRTYMADNIQEELTMGTVGTHFVQHIATRHSSDLSGRGPAGQLNMTNQSIALLIGSAVWDILESTPKDASFSNHLEACRVYVEHVRRKYPLVTVFWKSATAMHPHRLPDDCPTHEFCNRRARYMSSSRAEFLYTQQRKLMKELQVPFLDIYEATFLSASQSRESDGRHYTQELNDLISKMLFGLPT